MLDILIIAVVILTVSRISAEIAEKIGSIKLVGELVAGIFLGILIINYPNLLPHFSHIEKNESFKILCEFGILFLMFSSGLHIELDNLLQSSKRGVFIALGGIILPFGLGYGLGEFFLPESDLKTVQSLFIGTALSITAIAVSVRTLITLGQEKTKVGGAIISAAIIDDIAGLFLLAILVSIIEIGHMPSIVEFTTLAGKVIGFFVFAFLAGKYGADTIAHCFHKSRTMEAEFCISLIIVFIMAIAAEYAGMHHIIGAFTAGIMMRKLFTREIIQNIQGKASGITLGFLGPIFFVSIGLHINLEAVKIALLFVLFLIGAAILGKVLGCGVMAKMSKFSIKESLAIGFGMNGRGAVELIVAAIALESGIFNQPDHPVVRSIFSALVIMAIITTVIAPIGMQLLLKNKK